MAAGKDGANDYVIGVFDDPSRLDATQWNALLETQSSATPFMRLEYLNALHDSASATIRTGWTAQFIAVHEHERLVAACPLYVKDHSYGEYVFDWAWADAYQRHGLAYYPKLLIAVPFTPVPGVRLLARDDALKRFLLRAVQSLAQEAELSSAHLLFADERDLEAAQGARWMTRSTVQFHWSNRSPIPYADFADFLGSMQHDKRKKIRQERRRVHDTGIEFSARLGSEISESDWDFFYRCYTLTYRAHHSTPYLTREFFARVAASMAPHWLMFIASRGGKRLAASLVTVDPSRRSAFGRYWGCVEHIDCLHFEACYYQPLAWCITQHYQRFEGGAQGEHKMARGLLPVAAPSAHWLAHPQFAQAVADFLRREGRAVDDYMDDLNERRPFKA